MKAIKMNSKNLVPIKESFIDEDDLALELYIQGIACKDKISFENLYKATSSKVYGFALSILKNPSEAEDVLQDVFLKIYDNASMYAPSGKPMAWILTITKNLALMKFRKQKDNIDISDLTEVLASEEVANKEFISKEDKLVLDAAFKILSDEERNILILHASAGFKHREIAKILEMPLATVLSKYHRALKKMKKNMEEGMK